MLSALIYITFGVLVILGLILTFLDFPGIWLIDIAALILAIYDGFENITVLFLIILFLISILIAFIDNIVIAVGAKKMGSSKWGMFGAVLGGLVGVVIGNILGFLLGPLIGATLFELLFAHKDLKESLKSGFGSLVGIFVSVFLKSVITVTIVIVIISRII